MFIFSLVLLYLTLIAGLSALFILSRHAEIARNANVSVAIEGHNAIVEPLFLLFEHRFAALGRHMRERFYAALIALLDRFVPWFRRFTRHSEARLVSIVQTVRGKRELTYLGRNAASPHIQTIRDNQDRVMKKGGSIES